MFWERHDPGARHRVEGGADYRYRSAIFVTTEDQRERAVREVLAEQARRGDGVFVTTAVELDAPWQPAAPANQQYLHRRACRTA
jgi:peptide methionine sulfoxide reductase MsrA